jgi:hypothetical protein
MATDERRREKMTARVRPRVSFLFMDAFLQIEFRANKKEKGYRMKDRDCNAKAPASPPSCPG